MALIEHLERDNWQEFLRKTFEYVLHGLKNDRFRLVGSSADDLRSWLACGCHRGTKFTEPFCAGGGHSRPWKQRQALKKAGFQPECGTGILPVERHFKCPLAEAKQLKDDGRLEDQWLKGNCKTSCLGEFG